MQPVRPVASTGQTGQTGPTGYNDRSDRPREQLRTFKPKCPEEGTWKTNVPKLQGKRTNQGPTFGHLLNKYTKTVQQDRPLKRDLIHHRVGAMLRLQGGNSSGAGVIILSFHHRRCMLLYLGPHRHQMQLIRCGNMRGFGSSAFQCRIHHHIRGRKDQGCQYTTDWEHTNLVQLSRRHRSDRSPMTGQTGLSRDRRDLFLHRLNTA